MRINRKLLLTFLLLCLVTVSGFSTNPIVKIKPLGNKTFALYLSDLGNQKALVNVSVRLRREAESDLAEAKWWSWRFCIVPETPPNGRVVDRHAG
mgnify:CR=1 FL=1